MEIFIKGKSENEIRNDIMDYLKDSYNEHINSPYPLRIIFTFSPFLSYGIIEAIPYKDGLPEMKEYDPNDPPTHEYVGTVGDTTEEGYSSLEEALKEYSSNVDRIISRIVKETYMHSGRVIITLEDYRRAHNISKYKIIKHCGVSATQLNSYCSNEVTRIDLPVLARICSYLNCEIGDILRYIPYPKAEEKRNEGDCSNESVGD